jgi:hypothetical protein
MSFLETVPIAPNTDLPPKATPTTAGETLQNLFTIGDISDNGISVWASAVLKLYNTL